MAYHVLKPFTRFRIHSFGLIAILNPFSKWDTDFGMEPSQIQAFTLHSTVPSMDSRQYGYVRRALSELTVTQSQLYRQINSPCNFLGRAEFENLKTWNEFQK